MSLTLCTKEPFAGVADVALPAGKAARPVSLRARFDHVRRLLSAPNLGAGDIARCAVELREIAASAPLANDVPTQRVAVAGSLTLDLLGRAIASAIAQEGTLAIMHQAPYGAYLQEILDPSSCFHRFNPALVVVAPDWRNFSNFDDPKADVEAVVAQTVRMFDRLWTTLTERGARIIQHTLVPPPALWRGVADRRLAAGPRRQVQALNDALVAAAGERVHWVELDRLAEMVGLREWSAERFFFASRLPFNPRFLPDYMPWFRSAWRAQGARSKKVLALDLDNTLWGGVLGDDGIDAIALGPDHGPMGEAFAAWQRYLKSLGQRGVILAVCSKNSPNIAAAGFGHRHSALALADIAVFECSWQDKVGGLRRIARALNVGLDSVVFVDDNPAETALIRDQLPEVEAIDLGDDPVEFIERLDAGHWFDLATYTDEDFKRTEAYQARRLATEAQDDASDMAGYLQSLAMVGRLAPATATEMQRVAQLELKTNQFNLTTRRYTAADLAEFKKRDDVILLALSLKDRFGDHGLTSTLVIFHEGPTLRIASWLMSCRILLRSAEEFILRELIAIARLRGANALVGEYLPTEKNGIVANLYQRLGFASASTDQQWWRLDLDQPREPPATYIAKASS
jgi:FkbH-like protein